MNWTGGKRNKIKVKLELQKQREFFNRQRLKKVHSFLNIEPRLTHILPSIEVVRSNNSDLSKEHIENIDLNHLNPRNNDNIDLDIAKRKQFLLQDNDWAGVEDTGIFTKFAKNIEKSQKNEYRPVDNEIHVTLPRAKSSQHSMSPSTNDRLNTKADPSSFQTDNTNSLSPLTQNTTLMQSTDVESFGWHQFLTPNSTHTSSIINDDVQKNEPNTSSLTNRNLNVEHKWQSEPPKTIATTALYCVASESITASNLEWNKFIQAPNDNTFDKDLDVTSQKVILNSARHFNDEVTSINSFKENRLPSNCKDNSEALAIKNSNITSANESKVTQGYSIDKKNLKEPLSTGSNITIDQEVLKHIHDLEIKSAQLQLEIGFLKNDVKWLKKIIKKSEPYTKSREIKLRHTEDLDMSLSDITTPQHLTNWNVVNRDNVSTSSMDEMSFIDSPNTRKNNWKPSFVTHK